MWLQELLVAKWPTQLQQHERTCVRWMAESLAQNMALQSDTADLDQSFAFQEQHSVSDDNKSKLLRSEYWSQGPISFSTTSLPQLTAVRGLSKLVHLISNKMNNRDIVISSPRPAQYP